MTTTEPVRSSSPELAAMTLPKLKEVASQLGIEGAAKLKKDALVTAIADLQAANREAAKAEREARREARNAKKNSQREERNTSDNDGDDEQESSQDHSNHNSHDRNDRDNNDRGGRNRRDRNRGRNRDRNDRGGREEREPVIGEDDVLVPVGGLVDIMENYSFIRTGGYLPGPNDVYVSQGQVRKYGLRKGDVVTGQVRQLREGETRQKYNPLITLETINGVSVEEARNRVEFGKLVPLYPQERLRLETEPNVLTTRVIDLIAPIGKGQRGLIVSPPKAGKTMVLQSIANAITTNNPELLDKERFLVISKSDMLDDELKEEISAELKSSLKDISFSFISSVAQQGIQELKDKLWELIKNNKED